METQNTQPTQPATQPQPSVLTIPLAIIVAGVIIAGGIVASKYVDGTPSVPVTVQTASVTLPSVSVDDHIIGKSDAKIVFVEYSDTECPFCKVFHSTMHKLVSEFGPKNDVAWVYRHLPLYKPGANGQALHSRAGKEAEATECVADQLGNDGFWKYTDLVYQTTTSNNRLDPAQLPILAKKAGANVATFNTCLSNGQFTKKVDKQYEEGFAAGAQGTPYIVMVLKNKLTERDQKRILSELMTAVAKLSPGAAAPVDLISFDTDGSKITFSGALPYEMLKPLVESVIK